MTTAARTALLLGATGLVGRHCLDLLLAAQACRTVVTLGRRPLASEHPKHTHHVIDFDRLADYASLIDAQDVYCCLGTTMKQAGSREAFRKVDFEYPVEAAKIALANGAEQYLLVSALGADSGSFIFYNRIKGETEDVLCALPFYGVYVMRPSLLAGERQAARAGEQIAEAVLGVLSFALRGPLRKYRPTEARHVAAAMVATAGKRPGGVRVYEPEELRAAAAQQG